MSTLPPNTNTSGDKPYLACEPHTRIMNAEENQIIVVADAPIRSSAQQELMRTGRLPESVQWLEMNADAPLRDCLRLVAADVSSHRMVLIDGSAISQPLIATDLRRFCQSRDANGPSTISHSSFVRP